MNSHNIATHIHHLKTYASNMDWHAATNETCTSAIKELFRLAPTSHTWDALLELFAVWPEINDIQGWVRDIEPLINHWPWKLRKSILGQAQTRAEKSCVYRLAGVLIITDCEDLSGQKLSQWSRNEDWSNLKGIELRKVETEAAHLHTFLASPYLKQLHSIELCAMGSLSTKLPQIFNKLQLQHVDELRLISLNLTLTDIQDINQIIFSSQLKLLDLSSNFINGKDLVTMFGDKQFPLLQTLAINYCTINKNELSSIFQKLHHPTLSQIIFEGTVAAKELGTHSLKKTS